MFNPMEHDFSTFQVLSGGDTAEVEFTQAVPVSTPAADRAAASILNDRILQKPLCTIVCATDKIASAEKLCQAFIWIVSRGWDTSALPDLMRLSSGLKPLISKAMRSRLCDLPHRGLCHRAGDERESSYSETREL
jgi:hypothetical protein